MVYNNSTIPSTMLTTKARILHSQLATLYKDFVRGATVSRTAVNDVEASQLKPLREIPGPSSLPVIGTLHHFLAGGKYHNITGLDFTNNLYETYGPIVKIDAMIGRELMVFLFDAECASQVLWGENWMPIRPAFTSLEYYRKVYKKTKEQSLKPTGVVSEHLEPWKEFRSAVSPVLMRSKIINQYATVIDQVAQDMVTRMKSLRDDNYMLHNRFDDEINLWALESIGVVALGTRLNCLDPNLADNSPTKNLIQKIGEFFVVGEDLDFKPNIWKHFPTPTFYKGMKIYEDIENLSKYFIQKAITEITVNRTNEEKSVLERLMEIDEEVAYIMACDMLFAGIDTTTNTITATLYLLAKHPDKQQKLKEELLSKSEKRPYLRACIKESMRLMPVVISNARKTTKQYNILGYHIPKNTVVILAHQNMALMEKYYPRPTEYLPERWVAEKSDLLYHGNAHPFAFAPFGFGVRMCLGRRIADLEMETLLSRVLETFTVEWLGPPPRVVHNALNYIKGPFNFVFKD